MGSKAELCLLLSQRCLCVQMRYICVSDFMVMHFHHQDCSKTFITAKHLEGPCLPHNTQLCSLVQWKQQT